MVLQDFVEGPRSYPVIRKLSKFKMDNGTEELYPANGSEKRLLPTTWCDLELSQSERLFYKMSLSGRCSELTYTFVDLINGMAEKQLPTFSWQRPCRYVLVCGFCDPSISTYAPHERFWGSLLATQPASTQRCSKSPVVGISSFWSLPPWSKKANDPGFIWGSIWHAYTRKTICFGERPRQTISKVLWDPLHSCPLTFSIVVRQVKQRQFWCKTFGGIHLSPAASNEHLFQLFFVHPRPCSFNPDSERNRYAGSGCVGHTTSWRATDQGHLSMLVEWDCHI